MTRGTPGAKSTAHASRVCLDAGSMGIGVWCEMFVSDPLSYLYKNWDPVGSLRANVSNATVRCLSNMKLSEMLETRHAMSQVVREEVSLKSREWGYMLGSTYIRKVRFRDLGMIQQIEQKVVNRLRTPTGHAIRGRHSGRHTRPIASLSHRTPKLQQNP